MISQDYEGFTGSTGYFRGLLENLQDSAGLYGSSGVFKGFTWTSRSSKGFHGDSIGLHRSH